MQDRPDYVLCVRKDWDPRKVSWCGRDLVDAVGDIAAFVNTSQAVTNEGRTRICPECSTVLISQMKKNTYTPPRNVDHNAWCRCRSCE